MRNKSRKIQSCVEIGGNQEVNASAKEWNDTKVCIAGNNYPEKNEH